ncbi:DivIVA domain-containing protein [candidate division KSB1 bacterium]|nr:DivIVA domain-containing protein [candidate division KSB1 bacterium]
MKLTPLDIRKQEFKRVVMRGFDPEEVEAFLTMIADEFELLIREKNQLNDELIKLRTQLHDYQKVEHTLRDTLVKAQSNIDESRVSSRREAELIIHEAELEAENIIRDARDELLNIRQEISLVKAQKISFVSRLRHILDSQLELIEVLQSDDFSVEKVEKYSGYGKAGDLSKPQVKRPADVQKDFGSQESAHEPRIIRGDKRFGEPVKPAEADKEPKTTDEKNEGKDRISDQFIL